MRLNQEQKSRYSRQLVIPEVGEQGQIKLMKSRVLVVGAGGLGSSSAFYLAAAGVGTLGIADHDRVELSNLNRQILHRTNDVGRPKVQSAAEKLQALNPGIKVITHPEGILPKNVQTLVGEYDVVVSALDNFESRFSLHDGCFRAGIPLVEAGVLAWDALVMTVLPGQGPCYRCLHPELPSREDVLAPAQAGVLGAMPGFLGSLQALEAVKVILGVGKTLTGRILVVDGLTSSFREVPLRVNPNCPLCNHLDKLNN